MNKPTSTLMINFEQDAKLVSNLLEVLTREQSGLVMSDIDVIEAVMEEKTALLQNISLTANSRYAKLATGGFAPNESGMITWLKSQAKPALTESWERFQKSISQAKEMNRLNGVLINKHFNRNQQLLTHLQGSTGNSGVYGKNGQAQSQSGSRSSLIA
jgi:flagellar biosynthesis protein FlgN